MKAIRWTPVERAAITRKWRRASAKAHAKARNAKLFTMYALGKAGRKLDLSLFVPYPLLFPLVEEKAPRYGKR